MTARSIATVLLYAGTLIFTGNTYAGKEDLVGTLIVNDMNIEFYMEKPKHGMVMTSGKMMKMSGMPTHHPEVKVLDTDKGRLIPYLDVVIQFENLTTGETLRLPLPAMLGGWFHYGRNATLPGKGTYRVQIDVTSQELMRYKSMAKKWAAPASATFTYSWGG